MPFRKMCKPFDFTYSFNDDFLTAIKSASKFLRVRSSFAVGTRIFDANM